MEFMPFKADMDCIKKGLEVFRTAGMKNAGFVLIRGIRSWAPAVMMILP